MGYSKDLWDQFELIRQKNVEQRKYYEQFINIVNERANLEDQYRAGLLKLNQTLQEHLQEEGNFANVISAMKSDQANRATACDQLSSSLRIEVVDKGREIIDQHNNEAKRLIQDGKKWEKEMANILQCLEKSKQKYLTGEKTYQGHQLTADIAMNLSDVTNDKKQKNKQKSEGLSRESGEYEQSYKYWIKEFNIFIKNYKKEMENILDQIEKQDVEREEQLLDCVTKYLIFETQQQKSFEYDINGIIDLTNKIELKDGMKQYIEKQSTNTEFHKKAEFKEYHTFMSQSLDNTKKNFNQLWEKQMNLYIREAIFKDESDWEKLKKVKLDVQKDTFEWKQLMDVQSMILIFQEIYSLGDLEEEQLGQIQFSNSIEIVEMFKQIVVKGEKIRRFFIKILESYRLKKKTKLNSVQFQRAYELLTLVLDATLNDKDTYTGRKLLILSFYFNSNNEESGSVTSLQEKIEGHNLFMIREFWEGLIYESLHEELKFQKLLNHDRKEMLTDLVQREKNIIFSQLAIYAQYMLNMNLRKKQVKEILQKYGKFYQLQDDMSRELVLTIDSFVDKEYQGKISNASQGSEGALGLERQNSSFKGQIESLLNFTQSSLRY